ncbi:MAG: rRNA pseudouridine synthase [Oscillospiraceae bacterium]|nr:rRNA pseudouridine synthase [Oscillospiraceae bacterium]
MQDSKARIQKVLSEHGVMSRRAAEDAVAKGRVTVNGRKCEVGQKIDTRRDIVAVDGERVEFSRGKGKKLYIMLNKPRGCVTTNSDEYGRKCVADLVQNAPAKVYPIGRLDRVSEGLLLLTNDGAFANDIMHPSGHVSKTYRVTVRPGVTEEQLIKLSAGVMLDGKITMPATAHVITREAGRTVIQLTIYEGRNRQVRRMCEAVGLEVARLKRTSIGPLKLAMLPPGKWRELTPAELVSIRASVKKAKNRSGGV